MELQKLISKVSFKNGGIILLYVVSGNTQLEVTVMCGDDSVTSFEIEPGDFITFTPVQQTHDIDLQIFNKNDTALDHYDPILLLVYHFT